MLDIPALLVFIVPFKPLPIGSRHESLLKLACVLQQCKLSGDDRSTSSTGRNFTLSLSALICRAQNQFLHAPIQNLSDVDFVFRWARDFVNPAELLRLPTSPAKHSYHLAIKR